MWVRRGTARRYAQAMAEPGLDVVIATMLADLSTFVPGPVSGLPAPNVSLVSVARKAAGVGNFVGASTAAFDPIARTESKAVRIDATVRFSLWGKAITDADNLFTTLNGKLFAKETVLRNQGFLKFALTDSPMAESVTNPASWRRVADYQLLYEYAFEDLSDTASLITRIPATDTESGEQFTITGDVARWDNEKMTALHLRGTSQIAELAALAFIPGPAPTGTVTLLRTFDGAPGPPPMAGSLSAFIADTQGTSGARHEGLVFASIAAFTAALNDPSGAPITMGDWNLDGIDDVYTLSRKAVEPPILLPTLRDRFEIAYEHAKLDQTAVLYVRAAPRGS